jgi:thiol-disulfide isomerase/thioredoxin
MNQCLLIATLSACFLNVCLQSHSEAQDTTTRSYPVLSGVGLALMDKDGHVYVTKVLPSSPADKSKQIGEKDRLVAVEIDGDQTSLDGKTYSEAANLIRGPVGTRLLLTIQPHGEETTIKVPLTREPLEIEGVLGANYNHFVGKPCPKLTLISLDSEETSDLDDLKGKVVVLDFWASWCPTCYAPLTKLQELVTDKPQWRDKVAFVTVSVDADRSNAIDVEQEVAAILGNSKDN